MIRLTKRVKRGLGTLRSLIIDAADDSKPPTASVLASMRAREVADFNQALAWIEQEEAEVAPVEAREPCSCSTLCLSSVVSEDGRPDPVGFGLTACRKYAAK